MAKNSLLVRPTSIFGNLTNLVGRIGMAGFGKLSVIGVEVTCGATGATFRVILGVEIICGATRATFRIILVGVGSIVMLPTLFWGGWFSQAETQRKTISSTRAGFISIV